MDSALVKSASAVRTVDEFKKWSKTDLRAVLPHECLVCGWGHMHAGGVGLDIVVAVDYPLEHIDTIRNRAGAIDTPILRRWLAKKKPVTFNAARPWSDTPVKWLDSFRKHDLRNVLAHAVLDEERCAGTYHSFYRMPRAPGKKEVGILCEVLPLLHDTLCRVVQAVSVEDRFAACLGLLTKREQDILHWIGLGKTNSEIAAIRNVSENTVKHSVTEIFDKLCVSNRTQLVRRLSEHQARHVPGYATKFL